MVDVIVPQGFLAKVTVFSSCLWSLYITLMGSCCTLCSGFGTFLYAIPCVTSFVIHWGRHYIWNQSNTSKINWKYKEKINVKSQFLLPEKCQLGAKQRPDRTLNNLIRNQTSIILKGCIQIVNGQVNNYIVKSHRFVIVVTGSVLRRTIKVTRFP